MLARHRKGKYINYGFTLLELLVSITILSLIITISYSALRLGTKSWDASIKNINKNSSSRSAIDLIKNKIEHIYPIYWKKNAKRVLAFQGDEESIKFIAPSPQGREVGEYFEYLFVINKGLSHASIELFYEPHLPDDDDFFVSRDSPSREILNGLKAAKFAYYGAAENNSKDEWFAEWSDSFVSFPSAVQIIMDGQEETDIDMEFVIKLQSELYQL